MATLRVGTAAVVLMAWLSAFARAQDEFPGGWDFEVGYQTFAAQTVHGAAAGFGANYQGFGGYGVSPFSGIAVSLGGVPGSRVDNALPRALSNGGEPHAVFRRSNVDMRAQRTTVSTVQPRARSSRHAAKKRGRSR